jgi:hypothetical protein
MCAAGCNHEMDIYRRVAERNDELPEHCGAPMVAPMITPDISAYQAVAVDVATGKPPVISSRSAHRDFLKRNGYVEVGNESVGRKAGEVRGDFNVRGDLTQATRKALGKRS